MTEAELIRQQEQKQTEENAKNLDKADAKSKDIHAEQMEKHSGTADRNARNSKSVALKAGIADTEGARSDANTKTLQEQGAAKYRTQKREAKTRYDNSVLGKMNAEAEGKMSTDEWKAQNEADQKFVDDVKTRARDQQDKTKKHANWDRMNAQEQRLNENANRKDEEADRAGAKGARDEHVVAGEDTEAAAKQAGNLAADALGASAGGGASGIARMQAAQQARDKDSAGLLQSARQRKDVQEQKEVERRADADSTRDEADAVGSENATAQVEQNKQNMDNIAARHAPNLANPGDAEESEANQEEEVKQATDPEPQDTSKPEEKQKEEAAIQRVTAALKGLENIIPEDAKQRLIEAHKQGETEWNKVAGELNQTYADEIKKSGEMQIGGFNNAAGTKQNFNNKGERVDKNGNQLDDEGNIIPPGGRSSDRRMKEILEATDDGKDLNEVLLRGVR